MLVDTIPSLHLSWKEISLKWNLISFMEIFGSTSLSSTSSPWFLTNKISLATSCWVEDNCVDLLLVLIIFCLTGTTRTELGTARGGWIECTIKGFRWTTIWHKNDISLGIIKCLICSWCWEEHCILFPDFMGDIIQSQSHKISGLITGCNNYKVGIYSRFWMNELEESRASCTFSKMELLSYHGGREISDVG